MSFEGEKTKQNPRKSSKNHQETSFCLKKSRKFAKDNETQGFGKFSLVFFYQKDDFLIISLMIFEGEKIKQNPGKSSKNHQKIIILLEKIKKFCQKQ